MVMLQPWALGCTQYNLIQCWGGGEGGGSFFLQPYLEQMGNEPLFLFMSYCYICPCECGT